MKELHIYLDYSYPPDETITTFASTDLEVEIAEATGDSNTKIHTTQTHFCSWKYVNKGYRLFVHKDGHMIELKVGKNDSTDRLLKGTENLERLLLGEEFDFEKGDLRRSNENEN